MHQVCTYHIRVQGLVDESDLNAMSPLQTAVVRADTDEAYPYAATLCTIHSDQSGLIGLMRYLHGQGFVFLSVHREWEAANDGW